MARSDLYTRDEGLCRVCGADVPEDFAHTGHLYPRGHPLRTSQLKDLILLCPDCNGLMGQRTPEEAGLEIAPVGYSSGRTWEPTEMDRLRVAGRKYMRITKHKNALLNSLRGMAVTGQRQVEDMEQLSAICTRLKNRCARSLIGFVELDDLAPFAEALPRFGLLPLGKILSILPRRPKEYHNPSAMLKCFSGIVDRETNSVVRDGRSKHNRLAAGVRFVIGDNIVKTPSDAQDRRAREIYDARREYELSKLPEKRGRDGHAHLRAKGYVADVYLTALWCADSGKGLWTGDSLMPPRWEGCPDLTWLQELVEEYSVE